MITPMVNFIEDAYNEYVNAYIKYDEAHTKYINNKGYSSDMYVNPCSNNLLYEPLIDLYYAYAYLQGVIDTFEQSGFAFKIEYAEKQNFTIPKIIYIECYHVAYTFEEEANR